MGADPAALSASPVLVSMSSAGCGTPVFFCGSGLAILVVLRLGFEESSAASACCSTNLTSFPNTPLSPHSLGYCKTNHFRSFTNSVYNPCWLPLLSLVKALRFRRLAHSSIQNLSARAGALALRTISVLTTGPTFLHYASAITRLQPTCACIPVSAVFTVDHANLLAHSSTLRRHQA